MNDSDGFDNLIDWKNKYMLTCPLWTAKLVTVFFRNINSIKPLNWQELEKRPPNEMEFNVTEFCNAKCSFCCYRYSKPRYQMTNEIFEKAASEYYDLGGRKFLFNALTGEPLLDQHLFEKIKFLKSLGITESIGLTTNGILLNKEGIIDSLMDSGLTFMRISTSGFDKNVYEKVMGVKKYDEFFTGIRSLLRRNQENGNPIFIQIEVRGLIDSINTNDFRTEILPFIQSSQGKVNVAFLRQYIDWIGQIKEEDLPLGCGLQPKSKIRLKPCHLSFNLGVMANGELRLCNAQYGTKGRTDELTLGNIQTDTIKKLWFSEKAREVRRTTCGKNINDICKNCRGYMPVFK